MRCHRRIHVWLVVRISPQAHCPTASTSTTATITTAMIITTHNQEYHCRPRHHSSPACTCMRTRTRAHTRTRTHTLAGGVTYSVSAPSASARSHRRDQTFFVRHWSFRADRGLGRAVAAAASLGCPDPAASARAVDVDTDGSPKLFKGRTTAPGCSQCGCSTCG